MRNKDKESLVKLGKLCKAFRIKVMMMTQYDFAKEIGTTQATISRFERGDCDSAELLIAYIRKGLGRKVILKWLDEA